MVVVHITKMLVDSTTHITHLKISVEGKTLREGTWALGNRPGGALFANEELGVYVQQEEVRGEFQDTADFTPGTL